MLFLTKKKKSLVFMVLVLFLSVFFLVFHPLLSPVAYPRTLLFVVLVVGNRFFQQERAGRTGTP